MNITLLMMLMTSITFMFLKHPLAMAITIIIQTIMVAVTSGLMLGSFWFSYIILIIMLSGMLVLFMYMASIASNEKFNFSLKLTLMLFMLALFISMDFKQMEMKSMLINNIVIGLNKLFSSSSMLITMIMVIYLFFTMIVVSNIVNINAGPLRIKN